MIGRPQTIATDDWFFAKLFQFFFRVASAYSIFEMEIEVSEQMKKNEDAAQKPIEDIVAHPVSTQLKKNNEENHAPPIDGVVGHSANVLTRKGKFWK